MQIIKSAEFVKSSSKLSECPPSDRPEYAFIGRSNVGKSSLINMLTGRKKLAKTSATPGKTQLINHFSIDDRWFLVDLPGYGWAKVSKTEKAKWKDMTSEYLWGREKLYCLFVLLDSRLEPQKIDLEFIQKQGEDGIPMALVFTKADKQGASKTQQSIARYRKTLRKDWEELPPIFLTSAVTGTGREELLDFIHKVNTDAKKN
jgi:GTP-binding protein